LKNIFDPKIKKNKFPRRKFLKLLSLLSVTNFFSLFFKIKKAFAGSTTISLSGTASGFNPPNFIPMLTSNYSSGLQFATDFDSSGRYYSLGTTYGSGFFANYSGYACYRANMTIAGASGPINAPYINADNPSTSSNWIVPPFQPNWGSYTGVTVSWWAWAPSSNTGFMAWCLQTVGGSDGLDPWHAGGVANRICANSFDGDGNPFTPELTYTSGEWAHIVFTWAPNAASYVKGYKNGSYVAQSNAMWGVPGSSWVLGSSYGKGYGYQNGKIAFFSVWNRQLSSTEITNLYNSTKTLVY
jgi:hypothetical protein